jgi:transcription-repair coupling factor (superfamily II helicase)
MVVTGADRFGLAQLHQLRGRVGRGRQRGVAWLLTDPGRRLPAATERRLKALVAMDRLGAGFQVSARDLDLRGAGELLGDKQAGHLRLVGIERTSRCSSARWPRRAGRSRRRSGRRSWSSASTPSSRRGMWRRTRCGSSLHARLGTILRDGDAPGARGAGGGGEGPLWGGAGADAEPLRARPARAALAVRWTWRRLKPAAGSRGALPEGGAGPGGAAAGAEGWPRAAAPGAAGCGVRLAAAEELLDALEEEGRVAA